MGSPFGDDELEDGQPSGDEATSSGAVAALSSPSTGAAPKAIPDATGVHGGAAKDMYEGVSNPPEDDIVSTLAPNNPTKEASAPTEETTTGDDFMDGNFGGGGGMATGPKMTAPTLPATPAYQDPSAAHQQLEQDMTLDPNQYRPSVGRRALAAIASGLAGFGGNPNAVQMGQSILQGPLNRAKEQQQSKVQVDQQRIGDIDRQNAQSRQNYNDQVQQYGLQERDMRNQGYVNNQNAQAESRRALAQQRANAVTGFQPKDPNNPWAGGTATTASGKTIPNSAPPPAWIKDWSATPQGKTALLRMTLEQRQQVGQKIGLKGQQLQYFTVNGKLAEPTQHTTVVEHEGGFNNSSTRNGPEGGNGGGRGGAKGPANPDENVEAIVAKSTQDKQAFADQWQRDPATGSYISIDGTKQISGPEFNTRIDKFRTDANTKLARYGATIDAKGNVQRGGQRGEQASPVPQPAQQPQQGQQQQGQQQQAAPQPPKQDATKLPSNTKARNPKTGQVEWIVQGGKWIPAPRQQ